MNLVKSDKVLDISLFFHLEDLIHFISHQQEIHLMYGPLSFGSVTFMMLLILPGLADMITMRSARKIASSIS